MHLEAIPGKALQAMKLKTIPGNDIPEKAFLHYSRKCNFMNKFPGKAIISNVIPGISVQRLARQLHARQFPAISSNSNPGNAFKKQRKAGKAISDKTIPGKAIP